MAQVSTVSSEAFSLPQVVVPSYVDVGGGRVLAKFNGEASDSLELRCDRTRAYPGLLAPAPRTDAFYRAFAPYVDERHVLDVGCGAGAGLIHLAGAKSVVGIDSAEAAVWYAKHSVSGVEFRQMDASKDELPGAEVAILVDVLGEVSEPRDVLRRVGAAIGDGGVICVAEAEASVAQDLLPPVRRAFSRDQLGHLLCENGFTIEEWISDEGFLSVVARRVPNDWTRGMEAADMLRVEGLESEALDLLMAPPKTDDGGAAVSWYLRIAEICISRGDGDGALEALMEVQAREPDDARVLAGLARLTLGMGATEDASRFAIAAAQRDSANPHVALSLAQAVGVNLTPAESIALWSNVARLAPASVDIAVDLARAAASQEAYHVGITALERVREYYPQLSADFHLTLGWMYLMSSRVEESLMECRLAMVVEPDNEASGELMAAICEVRPKAVGDS